MPTNPSLIKKPVPSVIEAFSASAWTAKSLRGQHITGNFITDCIRPQAPADQVTLTAKI